MVQKYIQDNKEKFLNDLLELLKIPSISADSSYKKNIVECAELVSKYLTNSGVDKVEIMPTKGYPIVYGEKIINEHLPTVLIYGHYDVQPPDPLDLWETPPFEPIIKKSHICIKN